MSGGDFGPVGPAVAGEPPFAIGGASQLDLDAARSGAGSFTVSNVTGRPVRARVLVLPGAGADASWFQVVGESERALPVAGTATVDVAVRVPEKAPAGAFSFAVGAALEEAPDQVVSGPTVAFDVPAPKKRKFPWWIVILVVVALLLLVGGGILISSLTGPAAPQPTPPPSATAVPATRPVFNSDDFSVDESSMQEDLDLDGIADVSLSDTDLSPATTVRSPTIVSGTARGAGLVGEPTFEACREVRLSSESIAIAEFDGDAIVCVFTSDGHAAILQFGPSLPDETRKVRFTVWE